MLKVDLGLLKRRGRLEIEADLPPDHPLWDGSGIKLRKPLAVRLEAQEVGDDVLVRGRVWGEAGLECRRCLEPVIVPVDEDVAWLFRAGVDPATAEGEDVYAIPPRARDLELGPALREQMMLAVPMYAVCRAACRGLCPICGKNLNETTCDCEPSDSDDRWAPLLGLKKD
jgi:uncharacterized protein